MNVTETLFYFQESPSPSSQREQQSIILPIMAPQGTRRKLHESEGRCINEIQRGLNTS